MKLFTKLNENKVIMITESQAMDLLFEAATIQDIYQKYYSNIPQDIFQQIISADPTYNAEKPNKMGKYGKWLLTLYQKQNLKIEDLYKAKDYLSTFIKFNAKLQERDIMKYHSLQELFTSIEPFIQNPQQAATKSEEIRNIKEGAEKVYEDNKWLVVVPHTKEASCYYGKGTQWCTAADHSDNMFDTYNKDGFLYINILKGTDTKYQFHFESNSFMDATDRPIKQPIAEAIGLTPELVEFYKNKYGINSIALTSTYDLEEMEPVRGLPNYYVNDDLQELVMYNESTKTMELLYRVKSYDEEFCVACKLNRFIPLTGITHYCNLYDIKERRMVFNDGEFMYFNINGNNLIMFFENGNKGIFSLEEMRYTTTSLPQDSQITRINALKTFERYDNDLAIITYKNAVAPFSFSKGNILSQDYYRTTKKEFMYVANGSDLAFVSFIKGNNEYHDADILLYDGTLIPLPQLAQNASEIIAQHM